MTNGYLLHEPGIPPPGASYVSSPGYRFIASQSSGRSHMTMRSMGAHVAAMCFALCATATAAEQVSCEMWNTAEFFARATGDDVARCIVAGADPNAEDGKYSGRVPLRFAARYSDSPAAVSALLEAGANPTPPGVTGSRSATRRHPSPLFLAAVHGEEPDVVRLLVDAIAGEGAGMEHHAIHAFLGAARSNPDPAVVAVLLQAVADVNVEADEAVQGMNIRWNSRSYRFRVGTTPLHEASENANPAVAALLVSRGADVAARNHSGDTPLHRAADNPAVVEVLIAAVADVEARNHSGDTPLHRAARQSGSGGVAGLRWERTSRRRIMPETRHCTAPQAPRRWWSCCSRQAPIRGHGTGMAIPRCIGRPPSASPRR